MSQGIFRNASPRSDSSDFPSDNFDDTFLQHGTRDSRSATPWKNLELVSYDSAVLVSLLLFSSASINFDFNPPEDDAKFFKFSKSAEDGPPRAGRL